MTQPRVRTYHNPKAYLTELKIQQKSQYNYVHQNISLICGSQNSYLEVLKWEKSTIQKYIPRMAFKGLCRQNNLNFKYPFHSGIGIYPNTTQALLLKGQELKLYHIFQQAIPPTTTNIHEKSLKKRCLTLVIVQFLAP